jgi:hypothetical protein
VGGYCFSGKTTCIPYCPSSSKISNACISASILFIVVSRPLAVHSSFPGSSSPSLAPAPVAPYSKEKKKEEKRGLTFMEDVISQV